MFRFSSRNLSTHPCLLRRCRPRRRPKPHLESERQSQAERPFLRLARHWKYSIAGACLVLASLGAYLYFHSGASRMRATPGFSLSPVGVAEQRASEDSSGPIRILAGYSGQPRTDSAGRLWNADRYFFGGGSLAARSPDPSPEPAIRLFSNIPHRRLFLRDPAQARFLRIASVFLDSERKCIHVQRNDKWRRLTARIRH